MIPLVYIASPSYSGSTLLTFLLNAHPQIASIGELKWGTIDLVTYRCSCGALLRQCAFWNAIAADLRAADLPFDLRRPDTDFRCHGRTVADRIARARVRGAVFETVRTGLLATLPETRRAWRRTAAVNRAVIDSVLRLGDARLFVDASKDPVRLKHLMDTGDYDVYLLQLIRDGRGVTCSGVKHTGVPAVMAAREWVRTHRQIERLGIRIRPERRRVVRYEDLCEAPEAVMAELFAFLGVPPTGAVADYRAVPHHILGNAMRLRPAARVTVDNSWRTALTPAQLADFERVGGELNRGYGYT